MSIEGYVTGGYWTTSGKQLTFSIPMGKSLARVSSISVQECTMTVRQNGEYALGSSGGPQNVSLTNQWSTKVDPVTNTIGITIVFGTAYAVESNGACAVNVNIDLALA